MKKLSCDRFLSMLAILLAALVAVTMPARAAMIGDADISFHATRTVLFKGRTYTGPVWAVPGKQRHEQTINGFRLVVILRTDTGTATGSERLRELSDVAGARPGKPGRARQSRHRRGAAGREVPA
jgi:hypothetical protein